MSPNHWCIVVVRTVWHGSLRLKKMLSLVVSHCTQLLLYMYTYFSHIISRRLCWFFFFFQIHIPIFEHSDGPIYRPVYMEGAKSWHHWFLICFAMVDHSCDSFPESTIHTLSVLYSLHVNRPYATYYLYFQLKFSCFKILKAFAWSFGI